MSVARQSAVGGKKGDGDERRVGESRENGLGIVTLPCQAYSQQRSSRLQVGRSSQALLTTAGAPRTILDSTHRTLMQCITHVRKRMRHKRGQRSL